MVSYGRLMAWLSLLIMSWSKTTTSVWAWPDGQTVTAAPVGLDPTTDIAVL